MNPSLFAFFIKKENKDITIPYNNMQTPQYSVCKKIKEYNAEF